MSTHFFQNSVVSKLDLNIIPQLDTSSALLSASKGTNFIYKLANTSKHALDKESFNNTRPFAKKFSILKDKGINLIFHDLENPIFKNNLFLIDSLLPEILAELLIAYYSSNETTLAALTADLAQNNPLGFCIEEHHQFYEYKLKRFLTDTALGMMPSKVWNGQYDATGGYIIVKTDGELLCYHLYEKNNFEDYLFNNTRFETASTSRHDFGKIYEEDGKRYLKLNMQIRFLK